MEDGPDQDIDVAVVEAGDGVAELLTAELLPLTAEFPVMRSRAGFGSVLRGLLDELQDPVWCQRLAVTETPSGASAWRTALTSAAGEAIAPPSPRPTRWTMRWKPALNAFAITFADRFPSAETY
jgi:hypothetical protein